MPLDKLGEMMEDNNKKPAQIISILSGKEGTGKSTVAIGMTTLLNQVGFRVLLIDFDLSTHGASHFFEREIGEQASLMGISEFLLNNKLTNSNETTPIESLPTVIRSKEGFGFIPSTGDLNNPPLIEDVLNISREICTSRVESLLNISKGNYDFIIIDNQTGCNIISKTTTNHSTKSVIVSELDMISSDSVRVFINDFDGIFPEYTRHLINKLDYRERDNYQHISEMIFSEAKRLPPLPFDTRVKAASSKKERPYDHEIVTAFYNALFTTLSALLPNFRSVFEEYKINDMSYRDMYYERINSYVDDVFIDRSKSKSPTIDVDVVRNRNPSSWIWMILVYGSIGLIIFLIYRIFFFESYVCRIITYIILVFTLISIITLLFAYNEEKNRMKAYREKIEKDPGIRDELDNYQSLLLTQDMKFLTQFEQPNDEANNS